jgi:F-type H+-transporting ATPase subunit delta
MKNTRVARRYAMALMAAAEQQKNIESVSKDMELVGKVLNESRELRLFVASPIISPSKKRVVFDDLFGPRIGKETLTFIHLLTSKSREPVLQEIAEQFKLLHDEKLGIVTVEVRTSLEFNYGQEKDLRAELERMTGKKVRLQFVIDNTIKGGVVIRIGDTVLDGSVKRQLERMRERFVAAQAA